MFTVLQRLLGPHLGVTSDCLQLRSEELEKVANGLNHEVEFLQSVCNVTGPLEQHCLGELPTRVLPRRLDALPHLQVRIAPLRKNTGCSIDQVQSIFGRHVKDCCHRDAALNAIAEDSCDARKEGTHLAIIAVVPRNDPHHA
jgi:hypothetical protein